jgi:hypothetical protein
MGKYSNLFNQMVTQANTSAVADGADSFTASSGVGTVVSAEELATTSGTLQGELDAFHVIASTATVTSGTHTVNVANGYWHKVTASGNFTMAFTFPSGKTDGVVVEGYNFGSYTIGWPNGFKWDATVVPTFTVSGTDIIAVTQGSGNTLYGNVPIQGV